MRREITETPYVPHRYVDELPDTALANFGVWRDSLLRGDADAHALAYGLDAHVFETDARGARIPVLRNPPTLFEDVLVGIHYTKDPDARHRAIVGIFGSVAARDVSILANDFVLEQDGADEDRDLQGRILCRIESGHWNDADLAWCQRRAAEQVTEADLLAMMPFDGGKEGDIRELSRRVVRGRRDHVCHWTGLTIPAGEPHLVLRELIDGEFYRTRHGRVAAWFEVHCQDGTLAEMLKRQAEAPLAAAA